MRRVVRCEQTGPNEGDYRYLLEVDLGQPGRRLTVVGKNPSTAGGDRSDATLGKIENWAARNGFGSVTLVNLFAVRRTKPEKVLAESYEAAVGPDGDRWLLAGVDAGAAVAAWGDPNGIDRAMYDRRAQEVVSLIGQDRLSLVGTRTAKGYPRHGLMWNNGPVLAIW